jgi:hypothetical protein
VIIINLFFALHSIYTNKMALLQFRGGQVAGLPASNEQAIGEIAESLGLGVGQYLSRKKVQMLANPVNYLTDRNTALAAVGAGTTAAYDAKLDALVNSIAGPPLAVAGLVTQAHADARVAKRTAVHNSPWVKQLAAGLMAKVQAAEVEMVDINFPIQNKAEKFQKSINKRTMAGKKELIEEGS